MRVHNLAHSGLVLFCLLGMTIIPLDNLSAQGKKEAGKNDHEPKKSKFDQPADVPSKQLQYDAKTNRWYFDEPSSTPVQPQLGPILTPPQFDNRQNNFPPSNNSNNFNNPGNNTLFTPPGQTYNNPPTFNWGGTVSPPSNTQYPGGYQPGYQPNFQPGGVVGNDPYRYQTLATQLRSNMSYLQALSIRENMSREQSQLIEVARQHTDQFADLIIRGADYNRLRAEYGAFDQAWHPAARLFAEGPYSNRMLYVVNAINQIDNTFHAEMHFEQANSYNRDQVSRLADELAGLTAQLVRENRYGGIALDERGRRYPGILAQAANSFQNTVRRDGDYDDVARAFQQVDSAWANLSSSLYQTPNFGLQNWQTGRRIFQVMHDLRDELTVAPTNQPHNDLTQIVEQLQIESQRILQLTREQNNRRAAYAAWAFAQDCQDLSIAISSGYGSFHRQIPQTLAAWSEIRQLLDGQQFVQPIQIVERNLRVLESLNN